MDLIIFFDVKNETLITRLVGRAAAAAVKRADDNEETIKKRIEIFNEKNGKIVEHYKDKCLRVRDSSPKSPTIAAPLQKSIDLTQIFLFFF